MTANAHKRLCTRSVPIALAAVLCGPASFPAQAATARLDATDPGTSFDGLVDGFPGIAPLDGTADVGGNALAVGFRTGVTEERAVAEYSLAELSGVASSSVTSATLAFNVDDVLSTFGPGTDFDGTASETIYVATYAADGVVGLDDFARGIPAGQVSVGSITDESLASSGPVVFELDITDAVRARLDEGASHLGVILSTDDSPTGTSLDDLGIGASGPPGVGGASLPFVLVEYGGSTGPGPTPNVSATPAPPPTPAPTSEITIDPTLGVVGTRSSGFGDQLLYFWDGRDGFTTFLAVRNLGADDLTIEMQLYGPDLGEPFADVVSVPAHGAEIFDIQELRDRGLDTDFGLAVAHAIGPSGEPVVSRALAGSLTVANLSTSSAWGTTATARIAVALDGGETQLPPAGDVIDGESVLLRAVRPEGVVLPLYFDPDSLDPAELDGNQIVFLSFNDEPGIPFRASARGTTWAIEAHTSDGTALSPADWTSEGVAVSDIVSVLGEESRGSSGSATLRAVAGGAYNRILFFTQSLANFGTGFLLPEESPE